MKEKFQQFMIQEGLNASRLAEMLGIQPAAISHLLSGRNKPSFDLLQKLFHKFPRLNPDWLLLDSDQMYRPTGTAESLHEQQETLFPVSADTNSLDKISENRGRVGQLHESARESNISDQSVGEFISSHSRDGMQIERIVVFYSDKTFESFSQRR